MREQQSQFEATLDNLEPISNFIGTFMHEAGLSSDQIYNFQVSADEHVSNLIEHAFQSRADQTISIICRDEDSRAQVIIIDNSAGFDPRQYSIPDVEGSAIYELPPGGFGNYFICELMDHVEYIHQPYQKNELILTLHKAEPIQTSGEQ